MHGPDGRDDCRRQIGLLAARFWAGLQWRPRKIQAPSNEGICDTEYGNENGSGHAPGQGGLPCSRIVAGRACGTAQRFPMLDLSRLTRLSRSAKTLILIAVDSLIGGATFWLAALARLGKIPEVSWQHMVAVTAFVMVLVPVLGLICGLYRPVVRFHIPRLSTRAGAVSGLTGAILAGLGTVGGAALPQTLGLGAVFALVLFVLLVVSRHEARLLLGATGAKGIPVAVYGAGSAGQQLVEVLRRGQELMPVVFIDDDLSLRGRTIEDLLVLNPGDKRLKERLKAKKVQEVLLAIPSVSAARRRTILEFLGNLPFHVRSVPSLSERVTGRISSVAQLKEISIEDLLGREAVAPLEGLLESCVKDKVVLVTGGGGSIGSELCRQIVALRPKRLIVQDHSEYALYEAERNLCGESQDPDVRSVLDFRLGSVADPHALDAVLGEYPVDTIFHAAAYKHVPIVEKNPLEGLRNNLLGTWYTARAAAEAGVGRFVLISSDKAVRPTNVMGASKRLSELALHVLSERRPGTVFSMVRFGNVLDSSGSVVPLFREQIEKGGPVTLTHPDVTRYFMTIHEAVQLVIQAGAMAKGGEVFVLDMGGPVRIKDLALKMIRLSGRPVRGVDDPNVGIPIEIVGLRPGEKLYEELLINGDSFPTQHPRIFQARESTADLAQYESDLVQFESASRSSPGSVDIARLLDRWVDGYSAGSPG